MSKIRVRHVLAGLLGLSLVVTAADAVEPAGALSGHHHHHKHACKVPEVKHSVLVNARPEHVWEAIQHERKGEDRTLVSYDGSLATIDEKFATLPIVGAATCTYVEKESTVFERIDYSLLKSDRFTVFQGYWLISPSKDGKATVVELSNAIDPGIRVPFWQDITRLAANRLVKKRLESVTAYAERLQKNSSLVLR